MLHDFAFVLVAAGLGLTGIWFAVDLGLQAFPVCGGVGLVGRAPVVLPPCADVVQHRDGMLGGDPWFSMGGRHDFGQELVH